MGTVESAAIIAALVTAIKSLVPERIVGWVTVLIAAVVGGALGYFQNGDVVGGVYNGLVAAGVVTVAKSISK